VSPARSEPGGPEAEGSPATLEQVLEQLEGTVRRLADQSAPLERLVGDWQRAQALAADAERRLEEAERRLRPTPEKGNAAGRPGRDGPAA
jgi:exodeoxyribonuclease VII small subunit